MEIIEPNARQTHNPNKHKSVSATIREEKRPEEQCPDEDKEAASVHPDRDLQNAPPPRATDPDGSSNKRILKEKRDAASLLAFFACRRPLLYPKPKEKEKEKEKKEKSGNPANSSENTRGQKSFTKAQLTSRTPGRPKKSSNSRATDVEDQARPQNRVGRSRQGDTQVHAESGQYNQTNPQPRTEFEQHGQDYPQARDRARRSNNKKIRPHPPNEHVHQQMPHPGMTQVGAPENSAYDEEEGMEEGVEEGVKEGIEEGVKEGIEEGVKEGMEEGVKEGMEEGMEEGVEEGVKGVEEGVEEGMEEGMEEFEEEGVEEFEEGDGEIREYEHEDAPNGPPDHRGAPHHQPVPSQREVRNPVQGEWVHATQPQNHPVEAHPRAPHLRQMSPPHDNRTPAQERGHYSQPRDLSVENHHPHTTQRSESRKPRGRS